MRNSEKVKQKILFNKIVSILSAIISLYLVYKYINLEYINSELISLFNKRITIGIYAFFLISILILVMLYINRLNKFLNNEEIFYELDNNIDKVFEKFGLYITKDHIICIGSKINFFRVYAIKIKDIDAIDTYLDSRYFYRKKGEKWSLFSFIIRCIKKNIMDDDNSVNVFNFICGKKVYYVTTASISDKRRNKEIEEIADYICGKYKDIDHI